MTSLRTSALTPIDAAALWPQLGRLSSEFVAGGPGNLLLPAAVESLGLGRIPSVPQAIVLGARSGFRFRGVLAARPRGRGAMWEIVSLRLADPDDDEAALTLLDACVRTVIHRAGRVLACRIDSDSGCDTPIRRAGLVPYVVERLHALPSSATAGPPPMPLRPVVPADSLGLFRLYCRHVPEGVRRHEAVTIDDFEALRDGYGFERELAGEGPDGTLDPWVGFRPGECRVLADGPEALSAGLAAVETLARDSRLVVPEYDHALSEAVERRGYIEVARRLVATRRLAPLMPLKETVSVPAGSYPVPH